MVEAPFMRFNTHPNPTPAPTSCGWDGTANNDDDDTVRCAHGILRVGSDGCGVYTGAKLARLDMDSRRERV